MTTLVEVRSVSRRFGAATALDDVSLDIPEGGFTVLLGPSGSGKTTLLNILGDPGAVGRPVLIAGEDVTHVPPARRPTATVFQDYALFPHMTVGANVGFGLRMRGVGASQREEVARTAFRLVGLEDVYDRKPHQLSGGQRQRVALARALAVEPKVLLLDEPLGALDLKLRRQMQDELKAIQRRVGTTFVHVTHDQEEAMALADLVVVMNYAQDRGPGPARSRLCAPGKPVHRNLHGRKHVDRRRSACTPRRMTRDRDRSWRAAGSRQCRSWPAAHRGDPAGTCALEIARRRLYVPRRNDHRRSDLSRCVRSRDGVRTGALPCPVACRTGQLPAPGEVIRAFVRAGDIAVLVR